MPIPGARRVSDKLGRESHVDGGTGMGMYTDIEEKKEKKDYGSSDRVLRPRGEGGKVVESGK